MAKLKYVHHVFKERQGQQKLLALDFKILDNIVLAEEKYHLQVQSKVIPLVFKHQLSTVKVGTKGLGCTLTNAGKLSNYGK